MRPATPLPFAALYRSLNITFPVAVVLKLWPFWVQGHQFGRALQPHDVVVSLLTALAFRNPIHALGLRDLVFIKNADVRRRRRNRRPHHGGSIARLHGHDVTCGTYGDRDQRIKGVVLERVGHVLHSVPEATARTIEPRKAVGRGPCERQGQNRRKETESEPYGVEDHNRQE